MSTSDGEKNISLVNMRQEPGGDAKRSPKTQVNKSFKMDPHVNYVVLFQYGLPTGIVVSKIMINSIC